MNTKISLTVLQKRNKIDIRNGLSLQVHKALIVSIGLHTDHITELNNIELVSMPVRNIFAGSQTLK